MFFNTKKKENTSLKQAKEVIGPGMVSVADLIAPSYIEVDFNHVKIDNKYYRTLFVVGYPRYVGPNWLYSLITFDHPLYISMFIYPSESKHVLDDLKRKIGEMEATIDTDMKAGKVVDPTVQASLDDAMALQSELARGAERFFQFGLYITIPADTLEELETITKQVDSELSSLLIIARVATLEMEEGFKSTLPTFNDKLINWRNMDTTSLAMTFPFSTASLTKNEGILYGVNTHDSSLIIFDRFTLENANSVVLGKSGGGKSFFTKLETLRQYMMGSEIIILDPENEYLKICNNVGGEYIEFASGATVKINPFQLNTISPDQDELASKILSLHGLMKVMMGELSDAQDALLDKALITAYAQKGITQDLKTFSRTMPLLEDLYKIFLGMESDETRHMAERLEKFVRGSAAGIFNAQTNIGITNPFTVFGVRDLGENLRPVGMYMILEYIWDLIRKDKKRRILVVDEAWYLIRNKDSAAYLFSFAKRARKYGLGMTTITQDVEDFLSTNEGRAIITNSSLQILLKQSNVAAEKVGEVFNLTNGEKNYLLTTEVGGGLFFAGSAHVGIQVIASDEERAIIE
jgi:conjugal transfer ATP-binding protein TraC